jgi:hypothetical protein
MYISFVRSSCKTDVTHGRRVSTSSTKTGMSRLRIVLDSDNVPGLRLRVQGEDDAEDRTGGRPLANDTAAREKSRIFTEVERPLVSPSAKIARCPCIYLRT